MLRIGPRPRSVHSRTGSLHAPSRSTTLYIGNLSFYTNEEQLHELFSKVGSHFLVMHTGSVASPSDLCVQVGAIDRIIMGLNRQSMTPCGFCFVIYYTREEAERAVKYLNG